MTHVVSWKEVAVSSSLVSIPYFLSFSTISRITALTLLAKIKWCEQRATCYAQSIYSYMLNKKYLKKKKRNVRCIRHLQRVIWTIPRSLTINASWNVIAAVMRRLFSQCVLLNITAGRTKRRIIFLTRQSTNEGRELLNKYKIQLN